MRRFFSFLGGGRCGGIEIADRQNSTLHSVTIHFDTAAEASGFYRSLQKVYEIECWPPDARGRGALTKPAHVAQIVNVQRK